MDFISGGFPINGWLSLGITIGNPIETISKRIHRGKLLFIDPESSKELIDAASFVVHEVAHEIGLEVGKYLIERGIDEANSFFETQYVQWKQSSEFRKSVFLKNEVWPYSLQSLSNNDYEIIIKSVFARRISPPQVMDETWNTINGHSDDIKKLVYSRLVSRNEIEKIADAPFKHVVNNAKEVEVYLADFDCLNATTSAEVLEQKNNDFVGSFVDYNNELKKKTTPDDKSPEERYIGDTLSVYGNLMILSTLMKNNAYKDKLRIYLCKGVKGLEKPYHTFRGTLVETNTKKIGVSMLMPQKAPGTVSTRLPLDVLGLYEKAEEEIQSMQPILIKNIDSQVSDYAEQLKKLIKEYDKFSSIQKDNILEKLDEIKNSEKESKIIVEKIRELQKIAIT